MECSGDGDEIEKEEINGLRFPLESLQPFFYHSFLVGMIRPVIQETWKTISESTSICRGNATLI